MNLVIDASALIAYLEDEPGAEMVDTMLGGSSDVCFAHSINLCEVYYGARREHGEQIAQEAIAMLRKTGLSIREEMDEDFWQAAGRIKADYRRVSLADCMCTALANRIGGEVVTADRHEFEALAAAGSCKVRFIR